MTRQFFWTAGVVLVCTAAFGQTAQNLTFEVASVKPSPPPNPNGPVFFGPPMGGPGTHDPGQITWSNAALRNVVMTAYDMQTYQVTAPDWLSNERYDIIAKVPEGATKEQVAVMWQNLLRERFGMVVHRDSKEFQVEELTVAKGGLKMKESELPADAEPFTPGSVKPGKNGPDFSGTGLIILVTAGPDGGSAHMVAKGLTMPEIATKFGQQQRHPVIDKTGLTGRYDFTVEYTMDLSGLPPPPGLPPKAPDVPSDPGSNFSSTIEKQLGLKLTPGKARLDVIVVDRAQKTPTEN
ncbi:MAG TPA: TIGR03435 family protein [Bryobacteraceae bacterium]